MIKINVKSGELAIHFDGACEIDPETGKRNPGGIATYGWVIKDKNKTLIYGYGGICRGEGATNNVAEYWGLIEALKAAKKAGLKISIVRGDSKLVIYQVTGRWNSYTEHLTELRNQVWELVDDNVDFYWFPREYNHEADSLSHDAYDMTLSHMHELPWTFTFD